jgi:hypothetical protein
MSKEIDYFGEFTTTLVLFESRIKYIEEAGVQILSKEVHNSKVDPNDILYLVKFKVNSITLLNIYSAGVRDGMNKSYKNKL